MTEWFQDAFGEDYLKIYSHRDDAEAGKIVKLIISTTGLSSGTRILDAPCGAGRHMRAFTAHGFPAYGFDLSPALLSQAVSEGAAHSTIVRADLRALPYKSETFDLVVNLFSSLGYFDTDQENIAVLCNLAKMVRPGGWFVVDFMNSENVRATLQKKSQRQTPEGVHIHDTRSIEGDQPRVKKQTLVTYPNGKTRTFNESVRLFTPEELRLALHQCGVKVEKEFGNYSGEPASRQSKRIILITQKPKS